MCSFYYIQRRELMRAHLPLIVSGKGNILTIGKGYPQNSIHHNSEEWGADGLNSGAQPLVLVRNQPLK